MLRTLEVTVGIVLCTMITITCREFGPEEAQKAGFLNNVCSEADLDSALEHALAGIEDIEHVRGELDSERLKTSYDAGKRQAYALAVEVLAGKNAEDPDGGHALHALARGHRYGFDLLEQTGLTSGTVYPALERLERLGLARSQWEDAELAHAGKRPPRKYYEITADGKAELVEALRRYRALAPLDIDGVRHGGEPACRTPSMSSGASAR